MRRPSLLRARLRLLNSALPLIAERSRGDRIRDGIISLALGTGFGVAGAVMIALAPAGGWGPGDPTPYLFVGAGLSTVSGILTLAWAPARERLSAQYMQMPMGHSAERRARVAYGERALDEMATDSRTRRTVEGIVQIVGSLALTLGYFWQPIFNPSPTAPARAWGIDALFIGINVVGVVGAIVSMVGRTEDERLRDAYRQQVRLMEAERAAGL